MLPMMKTNGWLPTVFNDILDTAFAPKSMLRSTPTAT